MAHHCPLYCGGEIRCLPALMDPTMTPDAEAVLAWLKADIEAEIPGATVLRVQPARDVDVAQWKADTTIAWVGDPTPDHTDPWLVFVRLSACPPAPS